MDLCRLRPCSSFRCFIDIPREIDLLADCDPASRGMVFQGGSLKRCDDASLAWCCRGVVLSVTGCMHAQQQIEIDDIKKNGYQGQSCENGLRPERTEALVEMQRRNASTHHELIAASASR